MAWWSRLLGAPKGRHAAGSRPVPVPAARLSWQAPPSAPLRQDTGAPVALTRPDAVAAPRGELTFRDGTTARSTPPRRASSPISLLCSLAAMGSSTRPNAPMSRV